MNLPNPFLSNSVAHPNPAAEQAGALNLPRLAPADLSTDSLGSDISNVGELFHHVRILIGEEKALRRFVLDERAFMELVEEPMPLFLRKAG